MRGKNFYFVPYVLFLIGGIIIPFFLIVLQSFQNDIGAFTGAHYWKIFSSTYIHLTFTSFLYAALITIVCLIIGYPAAYCLTQLKHKQIWLAFLVLPMWMNLLLKVYAFMSLLAKEGFINSVFGIFHLGPYQFLFTTTGFVIVAVYLFVPFMILPLFNAMEKLPSSIFDAAYDLGADTRTVFWRILWPLTSNGIYAGIQVVFIPALSLFMLTRLIGGNKIITLGTAIEQNFLVTQNYGLGSALAVLIIFVMLALFFGSYWWRKHTQGGK